MNYYALFLRKDAQIQDNPKCIGVIRCNDIEDDLFRKSITAKDELVYSNIINTYNYYSINIKKFASRLITLELVK